MKSTRGNIYISVLIIIMAFLLLITFIISSIISGTETSKDRNTSLKTYYSAESKLLQAVKEDFYLENSLLPVILTELQKRTYKSNTFYIDNNDILYKEDNNKINLVFNNKKFPQIIRLKTKSRIGNSNLSMYMDLNIINDIFYTREPYINQNKYSLSLDKFFKDFYENDYLFYEPNSGYDTILDRTSSLVEIFPDEDGDLLVLHDDSKLYSLSQDYIRFFYTNREYTNLYIDKYKDVDRLVNLSGIIYLRGNLIINSDFYFNGILIIEDGTIKVKKNNKVDIDGLIISNGSKNLSESIEFNYNETSISKHGPFLPGYIDLNIMDIREE